MRFLEHSFPCVALDLFHGQQGLCKTLFKAMGSKGGGSFPRLPGFYCLGPQLELVCWFFAESFNGEHLLPCFLVLQAQEICVQRGSEGGETEGRN